MTYNAAKDSYESWVLAINKIREELMTGNKWTVERDNRLKELRQRGFSARQIGADIGVSKNAVIGRTSRLGLSSKSKPALFAFSNTHANVCQFPHGHVGEPEFHFCEAEVVPGKPYCAEHCAICYRKEAA